MALTRWAVAALSTRARGSSTRSSLLPPLPAVLRTGRRARAQDPPEGAGSGGVSAGARRSAAAARRVEGGPAGLCPFSCPAPGPAWGLVRSTFSAARPAPGQPLTTANRRRRPDVASADLRPHAAWRLAREGRGSAAAGAVPGGDGGAVPVPVCSCGRACGCAGCTHELTRIHACACRCACTCLTANPPAPCGGSAASGLCSPGTPLSLTCRIGRC